MSPSMALMVVLFPAPFSPIKPMMHPMGRVRLTPSRVNVSYFLRRSRNSMALVIADVPFLRFLPEQFQGGEQLLLGHPAEGGGFCRLGQVVLHLAQLLLPQKFGVLSRHKAPLAGEGVQKPLPL